MHSFFITSFVFGFCSVMTQSSVVCSVIRVFKKLPKWSQFKIAVQILIIN